MPTIESLRISTVGSSPLHVAERQKLLFISPSAEDHAALRRIADDLDWQLRSFGTCGEGLQQLGSEPVTAVFCESILEDGTWKDILNRVGAGGEAPPLIVTSRIADGYLWSEVLNLGGYDVLATPFTPRDVAHVLATIALHASPTGNQIRVAGTA